MNLLAELAGAAKDVFKNLDRKVFLRIVVGDQAGLPCKIEIPAFVKCRKRDKDNNDTLTSGPRPTSAPNSDTKQHLCGSQTKFSFINFGQR